MSSKGGLIGFGSALIGISVGEFGEVLGLGRFTISMLVALGLMCIFVPLLPSK